MNADGETEYNLIHLGYKDGLNRITTSVLGISKDQCIPQELIFSVFKITDFQFEPAAKLQSGPMTVHLFKQFVKRDENKFLVIEYLTHILPTELKKIARFTPEISGYQLEGFSEAVDEYFSRTSHLVACD